MTQPTTCSICRRELATSHPMVHYTLDGMTKRTPFRAHTCEGCAVLLLAVADATVAQAVRRLGEQADRRLRYRDPDLLVVRAVRDRRAPSLLGRIHDTICGALLWVIDRG